MFAWVKRFIVGRPLENEALNHEKFSTFWGLPILSSDAISSVAYATEEILLVLVPVIGILAFHQLTIISGAIIGLLAILVVSYRQTIANYPNGGGSYIVASDNLGAYAGVVAGAALLTDYILTVAVSISSGVFNMASAFPFMLPYRVAISIAVLLLIYVGNLRGIRESAKIFGMPTYLFILGMLVMIVYGVFKIKVQHFVPPAPQHLPTAGLLHSVTLFLMLRAFSSGCTALTGVEAVSNAVPNFREPHVKNAKTVLLMLGFIVFFIFGGMTYLATLYRVTPLTDNSVLSQISGLIFGRGSIMYLFIQIMTMFILVLAANTAFADFPMLLSLMGRDGYAPRQMAVRGDRLSYSNGITLLTVMAIVLLLVFNADTTRLIPLYAVGVFISFTLSQSGMLVHWFRYKDKGWVRKAIVNGIGAFVTFITVFIIAITKFVHGAWIIVIIIPILMFGMLKIKRHYIAVAEQLRVTPEEAVDLCKESYRNHVIVPIESINRASIRALRYAKTISDHIVAFNVSTDEEQAKKMRERWNLLQTDIPLVVKYSPFRKVIEPLLDYIQSYEHHSYKKGDMITVILPQFSVRTWWHIFLHNQTRLLLSRNLLKHKHIVVATMPLQLQKDEDVLQRFSNKTR